MFYQTRFITELNRRFQIVLSSRHISSLCGLACMFPVACILPINKNTQPVFGQERKKLWTRCPEFGFWERTGLADVSDVYVCVTELNSVYIICLFMGIIFASLLSIQNFCFTATFRCFPLSTTRST